MEKKVKKGGRGLEKPPEKFLCPPSKGALFGTKAEVA